MRTNGLHTNGIPNGHHPPIKYNIPVLVVGGGPCGLLQAYLLAQLGVQCLVIERYPTRLAAPKAHALSPRSLELCRQFHLDTKYIRSRGSQRRGAFWVNFVTTLDGKHVGKLPYERMDTSVLDDTPEMIHNIPQPDFEQIVARQISLHTRTEFRKNVSFVKCHQHDNDHVDSIVEDRSTRELYVIRSRYVIGCDGARSRVRESLGVKSSGEDTPETMMTIHFKADLRPVVGSNVGILHWVLDPAVSGFIIGYDLSGNQVLIHNYDINRFPLDQWNEDRCRTILSAALGSDVQVQVLSWRPWVFRRSIADQYRIGKVFLAGDAAHSFPPTGGLGLNSGIADVHNLAYKLAAVLQGWARDSLLDSYQAERRHIAEINSQQSVKNGKKIFGLLKTLGTTTSDAVEARHNLHAFLRDTEKRKTIDTEIAEQQEHFDNLELHIGYVYGSKAFPPHASHYTPKYVVGARLPHAWIRVTRLGAPEGLAPTDVSYVSELSSDELADRRWSTLDLCNFDKMTFFHADTATSHARIASLTELIERDPALGKRSTPLLSTVAYGVDFTTLPGPAGDNFAAKARLTSDLGGGLLVRPDQHILLTIDSEKASQEIFHAIKMHLFGSLV